MSSRRLRTASAPAGSLLLAIVLAGCSGPLSALPLATAVVHEWPFAAGTLDGRRASQDPAITDATLSSLGVEWVFPTKGAVTGTPTVMGGRVFAATWLGSVVAINLSTGQQDWTHDVGARITGSVTLHDGLALFGDSKARLHAVRAATGEAVWNQTLDPTLNAHLYATPLVVPAQGDRPAFLVQAVGSDQESSTIHGRNPLTFRGSIVGVGLDTGGELWRTWLGPEGSLGTPVWGTPILVPDMDLVVFGTGNAYAAPAGPMTDSIVALHLANGSVAWHYQATAGDVFTHLNPISPDHDFGSTPSVVKDGDRTLVIMGQKSSVVWAIDAATGKLAWKEGKPQGGEGIIGDTAANEGLVFAPYVTLKKLVAIDWSTGKAVWNHSLGGLGFSDPVAVKGAVLAADTGGNLWGLEAATGRRLWTATVGEGGVFGGLSVADGHLFVPVVRKGFLDPAGAVIAFAPGRAPATTTASADASGSGLVVMRGFEFVPALQTIRAGASVTWTNEDPALHTVTFAGAHANFTPERELEGGESVTIAFDAPGTYEYYCRPHAVTDSQGVWQGMTGKIVVQDEA